MRPASERETATVVVVMVVAVIMVDRSGARGGCSGGKESAKGEDDGCEFLHHGHDGSAILPTTPPPSDTETMRPPASGKHRSPDQDEGVRSPSYPRLHAADLHRDP